MPTAGESFDVFVKSRACQWELTAAYLAAQRTGGDPRQRMLVVNPEPTNFHIYPVELRDAKFVTIDASPSDADLGALAAAVRSQVIALRGLLGEGQALAPPRWHGTAGTGSNRFVGRLSELWRLHTSLWNREHAIITGAFSGGTSQLTGLGGVGKSLLAEEYALRRGLSRRRVLDPCVRQQHGPPGRVGRRGIRGAERWMPRP